MEIRGLGFEPSFTDTLYDLIDFTDETDAKGQHHAPSRAYIREAKAIAATPGDVMELPNQYVFVIDMPGLKADQMKVLVEDGHTLVVNGERKREREKDQGVKYIKMERRLGKYLKKFNLPENADTDKISATYQEGVLTVCVGKKPAPENSKPRTIEVKVM